MALPVVQTQKILISDLQGMNIERGVLVRPENSFFVLENFDLVKPGVVRKIRGNKRLTATPVDASAQVVAFRDWQKEESGPEFLVAVTNNGKIATSGMFADPLLFGPISDLYLPVSLLDEAPYIVSLPFMENGVKVQYIVVTVGLKGTVVKYDGANVTPLGIPNPTDSWDPAIPYQHSMAVPQALYTDPTLGDIYLNSTTNQAQGIPLLEGRQYRGCWYNPITGHRSSLFGLSLQEYPTSGLAVPADRSQTKPLGTALATTAAPLLMAAPIFIDNLVNSIGARTINPVPVPQTGYTQLQVFATRQGDVTYYLVPRLYNKHGEVITDDNGAINIDQLKWGFTSITGNPPNLGPTFGQDTPIWDGFSPVMATVAVPNVFEWYGAIHFDEIINYTVSGGGQSGNTLNVHREQVDGNDTRSVQRAYFTILGDPTLYRITQVTTLTADDTWTIEPGLQATPPDNAQILLAFLRPVLDTELITPFSDAADIEGPFDRINDPPPMASWGAVYQNRLFLLDAQDKTRLVFSRIGDYESFPPDNIFRFSQADFDPITAILAGRQVGLVSQGADQRLIVAKQQSTYQVTGSSILDFALTGLFSETGIVQKRAATVISGFTAVLTRQGLEVVQDQMPYFIGTKIKDLIDLVRLEEYGPCFAIDRRDNQILMGFDFVFENPSPPGAQITKIVSMRTPRPGGEGFLSPFATITALPVRMSIIQESGAGDAVRMLMAGEDGHIYQLFTGGNVIQADESVVPLEATFITQELPQADRGTRKIFRRIRVDGNEVNDDPGWRISFSIDGSPFTDEVQLYDETLIGLAGKQLTIKVRHTRSVPEDEEPPQLSNMEIEYAVIGAAR